jgi:DNA-binding response OmpR family regulator
MNAATARRRAARDLRVLAVEDEALLAMALKDTLLDLGFAVLGPVGSVAKAQALIEREGSTIGCAVLDIDLGTETAYPIADALALRGVPFLFLTGYGAAGVEDRYRSVPLLVKPARAEALASLMGTIMGRRTSGAG